MIKIVALLSTLFINLYGAIFLFATSSKKFKNRFFLGLFFFNSFLLFVGHFLSFNEYWITFRYFDFIFLSALLAFYPLYYIYIYSAFNFNIVATKKSYHFIPPILVALLMFIMVLSTSWENYEMYMNNNLYGTEITTKEALWLSYMYKGSRFFHLGQILFYNYLTIRFLIIAKNKMQNFYSNLDKFQLQYFYIVTISFIVLMSIPGFYVTVIGRTPLDENGLQLLFMCSLFTLLFIILAIVGLRQIPAEINLSNNIETTKDATIHLKELNTIEAELLTYFKNDKPWLDPQLNILQVAKHIGTNRSYVSNIINEQIGCNFNQFVNSYRINEAKLLLKKSPKLSIAEISELSGFGSVNSFIRIFKASEHKTPALFKKLNS
ncbi:Helix-turn-helix domain-containing protein [Lutibacter agarilyticus]|uniref:Helix-turn-helix domain-containing protein n=1 Tax=Lutibacter agarilyticus TaxID=1109740 RepID=A0A238XJ04_9FLAO|nr:helix-turn-helix domain-containing protein [Lutibacter agarilyticus]SNR58672.1 Helix-turn-helix domain-containing protein [Lutibacter agarilyticus]